jgi:hypothetical protein
VAPGWHTAILLDLQTKTIALQRGGVNKTLRVRLAGLRLRLWQLWLWLCWWSGFCGGAESVLKKRLAKQLLLSV